MIVCLCCIDVIWDSVSSERFPSRLSVEIGTVLFKSNLSKFSKVREYVSKQR